MSGICQAARVPFLSDPERVTLAQILPLLQPQGVEAGVIDYIEATLTAFEHDPPHIWLDGPWHSAGEASRWMALGRLEELAWRARIEGWREAYRSNLAGLAGIEVTVDIIAEDFRELLFSHACEGLYADARYGGNRGNLGWETAGYEGDVLPRGWLPLEVSDPTGTGSLR
jgi:hypothetical protein